MSPRVRSTCARPPHVAPASRSLVGGRIEKYGCSGGLNISQVAVSADRLSRFARGTHFDPADVCGRQRSQRPH